MAGTLVLAVDTTTRTGSLAVARDGAVLAEMVGDGERTHGERLPGEIDLVLARAGVPLEAVDLFAVAAGPGSFTGLRVGIAAVQGLALAQGRKVVPVSSLEALARLGAVPDGLVAAWMDAQRGQVFAALYERHGTEPRLLDGPVSLPPSAVLDTWAGLLEQSKVTFAGDGALRYVSLVQERQPGATVLAPLPALAGTIAQIATARAQAAVAPHAIVPVYVRPPDAVIARERRDRPVR